MVAHNIRYPDVARLRLRVSGMQLVLAPPPNLPNNLHEISTLGEEFAASEKLGLAHNLLGFCERLAQTRLLGTGIFLPTLVCPKVVIAEESLRQIAKCRITRFAAGFADKSPETCQQKQIEKNRGVLAGAESNRSVSTAASSKSQHFLDTKKSKFAYTVTSHVD